MLTASYMKMSISCLLKSIVSVKAKKKICVLPIDPKILLLTLTFFMPKKKIDRQNP
jgi:hypothetical protein